MAALEHPLLDARGLEKRYGERVLLSDARVSIRRGERVGLVGRNGSGKTTLGRVLAGHEPLDGGEISLRRGARVVLLEQEPALPAGQRIREVVAGALAGWNEAQAAYHEVNEALSRPGADSDALAKQQHELSETIERLGGWERSHETDAVVSRLGLRDPERMVETLSGGERRRVALARTLLEAPDLAILDEPTNHLDVETIEWLEQFLLTEYTGALLLITHDRAILDRVTTRTLELSRGELYSYDGGYSRYLEARAERAAHEERSERNRQNFLRRELEWVRRQPKARSGKQKARMNRAMDALDTQAPKAEEAARLAATEARQGKTILSLDALRVERGGHTLINALTLALSPGQRVGIIGANGSGKTSLLLALQGELEAAGGEITLGAKTRIAYLDQARSGLDPNATIFESVGGERSVIEVADERLSVAQYLERFLFDRKAQRRKLSELSGGERARVCLARMLAEPSNLLLLDEPTNDLDVETLAALEAMLCDHGGCALVVSHDRWFLDRVATSILVFEGEGRVQLHVGNYSEVRARGVLAPASEPAPVAAAPAPTRAGNASAAAVPKPAKPLKLSFREERELSGLMEEIEQAEETVSRLETQLADPATYRDGGEGVSALRAELDAARAHADARTARWEELEARKEGAGS